MALVFLRRGTAFAPLSKIRLFPGILRFYSTIVNPESEATQTQFPSGNQNRTASGYSNSEIKLSPLLSHGRAHLGGCRIELVDDEAWRVSSGLVDAFKGKDRELEKEDLGSDEVMDSVPSGEDGMDIDELDDMRIKGNLFFKIDRESREFEEYSFEFHRRKSPKKKSDPKERERSDSKENENKRDSSAKLASGADKSLQNKAEAKDIAKRGNPRRDLVSEGGIKLPRDVVTEALDPWQYKTGSLRGGKKERTLTFNQLTAPYHEPFCLDIYVSKGSVRACIIHRATSNVVAVAHSISKDMKSDLSSLKNATTCAAVGEVLAQRALGDDIHNVVYTPRKDEKLEGKLLIVLQSIIDNGVNVKVKLRKRKVKRASRQLLG